MTFQSLASTRGTYRAPSLLNDRGARLIIAAVVSAQFVDITLFTVGGFVVSAQKLLVGAAIPVGILMLGRLRVPMSLLAPGVMFLMMLSAAWLFGGRAIPGVGSYLTAGLLNLVAAAAMACALAAVPDTFRWLARVWIFMATATGAVAIAQFMGVLPLFAVADEFTHMREAVAGYSRGTGFKFDPNFQATMLVIGLAFSRFYAPSRLKLLTTVVIVAGVACTLSRMGMLLCLVVLVATLNPIRAHATDVLTVVARRVSAVVAVVTLGLVTFALVPAEIQDFLAVRGGDAMSAIQQLARGGTSSSAGQISSAAERSQLFRGTVQMIQDNPVSGVGAGQVPTELAARGLPGKAAHNTYLELVAVGGIWGVFTMIAYTNGMVRGVRGIRDSVEARTVRLVVMCFVVQAFLITFIYNSFFWIPLSLVTGLALRRQFQFDDVSEVTR